MVLALGDNTIENLQVRMKGKASKVDVVLGVYY